MSKVPLSALHSPPPPPPPWERELPVPDKGAACVLPASVGEKLRGVCQRGAGSRDEPSGRQVPRWRDQGAGGNDRGGAAGVLGRQHLPETAAVGTWGSAGAGGRGPLGTGHRVSQLPAPFRRDSGMRTVTREERMVLGVHACGDHLAGHSWTRSPPQGADLGSGAAPGHSLSLFTPPIWGCRWLSWSKDPAPRPGRGAPPPCTGKTGGPGGGQGQ